MTIGKTRKIYKKGWRSGYRRGFRDGLLMMLAATGAVIIALRCA
jgi:hypothetical protein